LRHARVGHDRGGQARPPARHPRLQHPGEARGCAHHGDLEPVAGMSGGLRSSEEAGAPPALAEWRAAEEQLSALVLAAPSEYERSLRAVRRAADELRDCTTVDALTAVWQEPARRPRVDVLAVQPFVGAAFLLRYREIVAEQRAAAARRRI